MPLKNDVPLPDQTLFCLNVDNPPHCFSIPSTTPTKTFYRDQALRGDIRRYYRLVRTTTNAHHLTPVGSHGITCGELAISVLRNRHCRRK